jgi:hypothetical protein
MHVILIQDGTTVVMAKSMKVIVREQHHLVDMVMAI